MLNVLRPLLRQLYRLQPAVVRRWELRGLARLLARPLNPTRPVVKGDVVVVGFLGTASGLGEGARRMLTRLHAAGLDVHGANVSRFAVMEDFNGGPLWPAQATEGGVAIFHINPDVINLVMATIGRARLRQRRIIGYWAWELEKIPPSWIKTLPNVDEVWVPSTFIANALRNVAPDKPIYVIPHPLDVDTTPTQPRQPVLPQFANKLIVFFMYDVRSSHARKNPTAVIETFRRAAAETPNAVLLVKINNPHVWPESLRLLKSAAHGMESVHILHETFSPAAMQEVMARVDIVLSLHRAEGFGFLMAEGMAAGKPVIATNWSANLDFMTKENSVLIDAVPIPAQDPQHIYEGAETVWADPDLDQAAHALKRLLTDPAERHRLGTAARHTLATFSDKEKWRTRLPLSFWESYKTKS